MTDEQTALAFHFARIRTRLAAAEPGGPETEDNHVAHPVPACRADTLAVRFDLSAFERDLILLAAFGELEPDGDSLISEAQKDPRARKPTVALALSTLEGAHWSALAPDGSLRRYGLIELEGQSLTEQTISLPERLLHFLVGLDAPDGLVELLSRPVRIPETLPPTVRAVADDLARRFRGQTDDGPPVVALCGPDPAGKAALVAAAAFQADVQAFLMNSCDVPAAGRDRALLARKWSREALLSGAVLVIDASETVAPAEAQTVAAMAEAVEGHVVILSPEPIALRHRHMVRLDVPRTPSAEQRALWTAALGPSAKNLDGTVDRLAAHFSFNAAAIKTIGTEAQSEAEGLDEARLAAAVWAACRRQGRPKLDELAQRIVGVAGWDDIVLPARQLDTLRVLAAQVRQRATVYEAWGFGARGVRGLGINALFAGASGTGKTLAAEILGAALELDVYRIDLSAVVSKWIGETEKNLRRVFDAAEDGCAVLLFDEADALFGKRSDVKDSHDRYANIEVSYLLQRMEAYRGLAILTTNLKSHIDDGFLRRIRFVIDFPFPGKIERREIWRRVFPNETPTEELDWDRLAQLNIPGGSIRNIAVNAAFLAADAGGPVRMDHILAAAKTEYDKTGKSMTEGELRGWRRGATHG